MNMFEFFNQGSNKQLIKKVMLKGVGLTPRNINSPSEFPTLNGRQRGQGTISGKILRNQVQRVPVQKTPVQRNEVQKNKVQRNPVQRNEVIRNSSLKTPVDRVNTSLDMLHNPFMDKSKKDSENVSFKKTGKADEVGSGMSNNQVFSMLEQVETFKELFT